jgi:hypothetical protein
MEILIYKFITEYSPPISLFILLIILINSNLRRVLAKQTFRFLGIISLIILVYYVLFTIWYSVSYVFLGHVGPSVAIGSYMFQKGDLVYRSLNLPETTIFYYGPMLFILDGFFIKLFGANIFAAKIGGVISGNLSLLLLFFALRKKLGDRFSLICCGYLALIYIYARVFSTLSCTYWNRPDPYILFFISLGLLCAAQNKKWIAIIVSGLALGAVANLKITEAFYFIPIYALIYLRYGIRKVIMSLIIGAVALILPFVLFQNISLQNYIVSLGIAASIAKHGLELRLFNVNMSFVVSAILIPILFLITLIFTTGIENLNKVYRENKLYIGSFFISTMIVAVLGSKPGSDANHMMPVVLLSVYALSFFYEYKNDVKLFSQNVSLTLISAVSIWVIVSVIAWPTLLKEVRFIKKFNQRSIHESDVVSDISNIMKKYKNNTIEMGYGGEYGLTFCRPLLVFAKNHYLLDPFSLMDKEFVGLTISQETLSYLTKRKIEIFLIPKGGMPFDLINFLNGKPLFTDEFKKCFLDNYELEEQTKYFDVWSCKKGLGERPFSLKN